MLAARAMFVLSSPSGAGKTTLSRASCSERDEHRAVDFGDVPCEKAERSRREAIIILFRPRQLRGNGEEGELIGMGRGLWQSLRHAARRRWRRRWARARMFLSISTYQGTSQLKRENPRGTVRVFILPPSAPETAAPSSVAARRIPRPRSTAKRNHTAKEELLPLGRIRLCRHECRFSSRFRRHGFDLSAAERMKRARRSGSRFRRNRSRSSFRATRRAVAARTVFPALQILGALSLPQAAAYSPGIGATLPVRTSASMSLASWSEPT